MSADLTNISGAIIVNKPMGITSHDVVGKIRKIFKTRQVGHTGTLDPMATGVLLVLVGRAVKASDLLMAGKKGYKASLKLGYTSDTDDITGVLTKTETTIPDKETVLNAISSFVGEIDQVPPMYSAIKVGGKKLVDLAREGIVVERQARKITIDSINADGFGDSYDMEVECSKGTYIRTLCADIGIKLGCGAVMSALNRTHVGGFGIDKSYTLEQLEAMNEDELQNAVIDVESLFENLDSVKLSDFYSKLCTNGCEIYQNKIKTSFGVNSLLKVYSSDKFLGIGEVLNYEKGTAIKLKIHF